MPHQGTPADAHSSLVLEILRCTQNDRLALVTQNDRLALVTQNDRLALVTQDDRLALVTQNDSLRPVILSAAKNLSSLPGHHQSHER
ncbi:MAG TPA: hypothetical protein VNG51_20620 [Ktedonobacteraceae bacterium]|nr:hypothetical protein [Ktedonobacteraceae bacterium]